MNGTAIETVSSVSQEQKRSALDAILHSHTFARADQLKSFLRYVCEMEFAGRGQELTEYLIGVEALGRPSNYSPGDDSAVRNRAFALRKKLQEFYEHEHQDAAIRIEVPKGSYCPHFIEAVQLENSGATAALLMIPAVAPAPLPPATVEVAPLVPARDEALEFTAISAEKVAAPFGKKMLGAFFAGAAVMALIATIIYWMTAKPPSLAGARSAPEILAEAWGPMLSDSADVLICVANPPSLSIHPSSSATPVASGSPSTFNDPGGRPIPKELIDWYNQRYPTPEDQSLYLTITTNATYWGDSIGAMTALKTLSSAGVAPKLFPEKVISMPTLRQRNVVLVGAPEYSPSVAHFLEKCPLTVSYMSSIISRDDQFPANRYSTRRDEKNRLVQVYGLITVLPSESTTNHQHRTLIFSGVNSAGTQAAAEFFSSPENLIELRRHLKQEGHQNFPPAYQVAVSAETDDNILLNFRYETHRVISALPGH